MKKHFFDDGTTNIDLAINRNTVDPKDAGCLHEIFENQTDRNPHLPALISSQLTLSYLQLDARANQMAHFLRAQGAGNGKFVGIYFERSMNPIIAILAALKVGATYVPIDPAFPRDRIGYIIEETNLSMMITEGALAERAREFFDGPVIPMDLLGAEMGKFPTHRLSRLDTGVSPNDIAYLIYTSGTTGRPKGVMAEHRNAFLYTHAFNEVCGTKESDRVYQGFSLGFDGSIEEIWMAYSNGSSLVVADRDTPKFGNELGQFLDKMGVTYFSTVPTLLSTITDAIPSLKILVLSGEICPVELVNRWAKPGLTLWNVYGPTEACVNTSAKECLPGKAVTIGKPLRGYDIYILNEEMKPVAHGESGELFVGGETLARGYLKRPDLTAEKFITLPELNNEKNVRVYRTGDLVRWNGDNELDFFGRIDSQVKIRGYRVELAEIESLLLEQEEIRSAVVKLVETNGLQELAAYVVLSIEEDKLDRNLLLTKLEARLPPYMVPGFLEVLPAFPMLASGKTDRKALPEPSHPLVKAKGVVIEPATEMEEKVVAVWQKIFGISQISVEDHFFLDLGGHSLMAAKVATALRQEVSQSIAVKDIYSNPNVRKLAANINAAQSVESTRTKSNESKPTASAKENFQRYSNPTYRVVAALQAISQLLLASLFALPYVIYFILVYSWLSGDVSTGMCIAAIALTIPLTSFFNLALSICAKWLLIGKYKAGVYPLWGTYYFRWWLANRIHVAAKPDWLTGTPVISLYFRLMGAKIGKNCIIDTAQVSSFDLISIGDNSAIGSDSQLLGYRVENGMLMIGSVEIGKNCFVGIHSALALNVKMQDNSALDDQSMLPDNGILATGKTYRGSPAQLAEVSLPKAPEDAPQARPIFFGAMFVTLSILLDFASLPLTIGTLVLLAEAYINFGVSGAVLAAIAAVPLGFLAICLYIVALKRAILNRSKPGIYSVNSFAYVRKWLADRVVRSSKVVLLPLYTTMFLPHWLRLLGAKIGKRAEISVLAYFAPDLIELGEESFFADSSIVGGKRFYNGHVELAKNKVGKRSFVGNSAILPVGASIGDGCLLGVLSLPPQKETPSGSDWLGSPAFALPRRDKEKIQDFSVEETFHPTKQLYFQRALIDGCRILIPGYTALSAAIMGIWAENLMIRLGGIPAVFASMPFVSLALAFYGMFVVVATKKLVMGTFKPEVKPLWCTYIWANEMLNGAFESIMSPAMISFHGTPFIAMFLRWIGVKVGKRCYIESTLFSEFDLIEMGDYVALNRTSIVQNHLFEDRIMKSSYIKIEDEVSIGNLAVVLYDTEIKSGAVLGPLSLVMKGETLRAQTKWHGIPTIQVTAAQENGDRKRPVQTDQRLRRVRTLDFRKRFFRSLNNISSKPRKYKNKAVTAGQRPLDLQ